MKTKITIVALAFATMLGYSQDLQVLNKIRGEATRKSEVEKISYQLLDEAGPRLVGSDGAERGYAVAQRVMEEYGLSNPRVEFARKWHRGGWDIEKAYTAMTAPYYLPVFPAVVGWCGGTGGLKKAEVVLIQARDSAELIRKYKGKLKDKVVLMPSTLDYTVSFEPMATRQTEESLREIQQNPIVTPKPRSYVRNPFHGILIEFVRGEQPLAIVNESGEFNNPGITFHNHMQGTKPIPAEFNVTLEVHGLMERLLKHGEKVEMELDIKTKFTPNRPVKNVIAEIPGTDLKDEIVLIGGHLDCYPQSTGAGDDGAGCIVMMEAMRILKAIGVTPRRTVRIALWGGEETGIHGSFGYVEQHVGSADKRLAEYDKISVYLNSDYGPGKFRGIYTQDNMMVVPLFTQWLAPLTDMGCSTVSNRSVGSTDHVPFDMVGIPAFQFIQDNLEWGRGSHRTTDFAERLIYDDLRHNAMVVAWLVYKASMMDEMIPRKR